MTACRLIIEHFLALLSLSKKSFSCQAQYDAVTNSCHKMALQTSCNCTSANVRIVEFLNRSSNSIAYLRFILKKVHSIQLIRVIMMKNLWNKIRRMYFPEYIHSTTLRRLTKIKAFKSICDERWMGQLHRIPVC